MLLEPDGQSEALLVFLRWPEAGRVKTRLAADVGGQRAAMAYARMTAEVRATVLEWDRPDTRCVFLVTPDDRADEMAGEGQGDGGLGARLQRAFTREFGAGARRVCVIGTDCPSLTADDLDDAFDALEEHDAVLGPALDGGYWLLGLSAPHPAAFDGIDWGTSDVLAQTRFRLEGLRVTELTSRRDLDTLADLEAEGRLDLVGAEPS